jgi:polar amino acid transport system substrate-binding protein
MKNALAPVVGAFLCLLLVSAARADGLDEVRRRGALRWGADQEGGGPYIYPDPRASGRVVGFEVDLMALLAERLGVRSEFRQCEWSNLPDLLRAGGIDVITNGYELTGAHLATKIATIPYYIYELQLIARKDDASIASWDDLGRPGGRRKVVGVLGGSVGETYVRQRVGDRAEVRTYTGSTDAMRDVRNGQIDATVQDLPPAIFYRNRFPELHFVGAPVGRGYYVMYLRPDDGRLRDELNAGLRDLIASGKLRAIYEHYGIWNDTQEQLGGGGERVEQSVELRGWEVLRRNLPTLLEAAGMTVFLTCTAMPLAIVVGLLVGLGRLYGPSPVRGVLGVYVEVLRGTPVMLQLVTIYYVIPPALGFNLNPVLAAVLGLGLNYSAYEAEVYRAGLLAIPAGQMEAALALGMSRVTALRRIIVPQAVRLVVPAVTNDFIALFKDTSICATITVVELTKRYLILVNSTNAYLELALVTGCLYLLMSYPLSILARRLERQFPHGHI